MHKNGHAGMSLLLSAPFVAIFIILEQYVFAFLFVTLMLTWSGLPDVDIYLQKYKPVSYSSYPIVHWNWIPVLKLSVMLMVFSGKYIDKVPEEYEMESVTHRGLTHSLWFSIAFGFFSAVVTSILILAVIGADIYFGTNVYMNLTDLFNANPIYLVPLMFTIGFLSIVFHTIGDIFTPTGIHFLTPRTDYGYTFDQFYAKNEVANRSALPLGFIMLSYAIFFGFSFGEINTLYLIGGFIGLFITLIPLWLLFVRTRIGKWVYIIYDYLK